jgi:Transcriptional regulatory protein, C terminal
LIYTYFLISPHLFLDKADQFTRLFGQGPNAEEVAGHVQPGTRMLGRAEANAGAGPGGDGRTASGPEPGAGGAEPADSRAAGRDSGAAGPGAPVVARPGSDGTLLAVVPIPGTGTSLAIVGYPVTTPGAVPGLVPAAGQGAGDEAAADAQAGSVTGVAGLVTGAATTAEGAGLLLDHEQRRLWVDGAEVPLTFQEFELLAFLAAHPATVFGRADLVREVWQRDFTADSRTVDVHVSRLRHKLGPFYGKCLVTEYRVGYQFRPPATR